MTTKSTEARRPSFSDLNAIPEDSIEDMGTSSSSSTSSSTTSSPKTSPQARRRSSLLFEQTRFTKLEDIASSLSNGIFIETRLEKDPKKYIYAVGKDEEGSVAIINITEAIKEHLVIGKGAFGIVLAIAHTPYHKLPEHLSFALKVNHLFVDRKKLSRNYENEQNIPSRLRKRFGNVEGITPPPYLLINLPADEKALLFKRYEADLFAVIKEEHTDLLPKPQVKFLKNALETQKEFVSRNILRGLAMILKEGICHKDICPQNILVSRFESAKENDGGFPQLHTDIGDWGGAYYFAPFENVLYNSEGDRRSDEELLQFFKNLYDSLGYMTGGLYTTPARELKLLQNCAQEIGLVLQSPQPSINTLLEDYKIILNLSELATILCGGISLYNLWTEEMPFFADENRRCIIVESEKNTQELDTSGCSPEYRDLILKLISPFETRISKDDLIGTLHEKFGISINLTSDN